jgi:ketosteroid isomerase-like protein
MKQSIPNPEVAAVMEAVRQGLLNRDARAVAEAYAPDSVIYDLAPPLAHSIEVEQLANWLEGWGGPVDQKLQDFKLTVNGDLAVGHGLVHVSTRTKSGDDAAWWMRLTVCLTRHSGNWKITHEHTSVPFYMDGSYRAAIDLSP